MSDVTYETTMPESSVVNEAKVVNYVTRDDLTFEEVWNYTWQEGIKYELYEGRLIVQAAANSRHQAISGELHALFHNYLKGKKCRVLATVAVRLNHATKDDTYFIPDLTVVCDPLKIDKQSINGAPDMVVEIFSPSSKRFDIIEKRYKYEQAGVKEYWLVDPEIGAVEVALLDETGRYLSRMYSNKNTVPVTVLPGFSVDLTEIFEDLWDDAGQN